MTVGLFVRSRFLPAMSAVMLAAGWLTVPVAQASECPSTNVGGKAIGWIEFANSRVPIKQFDYPAGGELDPPASAAVVGASSLHRPLLSKKGTTVLAWHVRYGAGCKGALNPLLKRPIGATFDIVTASGSRQTFKLVDKTTVKRGNYKPEWFRVNGPAQVAMFTCSDLRNGKFNKTSALFAEPVL